MLVTLDATHEDAFLPFRYKHRNQLTLPVGPWRPGEDATLHVSDEGLTGTLRFNRMTWPCHLPWSSIVALAGMDGRGTFWRGEARDDPARVHGVEIVPIHEDFQRYLVINGEAIVSERDSTFVIEGQQFPGIRWIDWSGPRARIGGDLQDLLRHLNIKSDADTRKLRFYAALGYVSGKRTSRVQWQHCRLKLLADGVAEFRASTYYESHFGIIGPMPYLREWWFRLARFLSKKA